MHSHDDHECREDGVERYLEREGLASCPVGLNQADKAEEEYETMSDSGTSVAQPDGPDPGLDVLSLGSSLRLGSPEPCSPGPNPEDISDDEVPALSPGGSSMMDTEPSEPVTPSGEQDNSKHDCPIVSSNHNSPTLDESTAVVNKVLELMVTDQAPTVLDGAPEQQDHGTTTPKVTLEELAATVSLVAMAVASTDVSGVDERSPTPPGMWPCKVAHCEAGPFRAKWQLTYAPTLESSKQQAR